MNRDLPARGRQRIRASEPYFVREHFNFRANTRIPERWCIDVHDGRYRTTIAAASPDEANAILESQYVGYRVARYDRMAKVLSDVSDDGPIRDGTQGGSAMTGREC